MNFHFVAAASARIVHRCMNRCRHGLITWPRPAQECVGISVREPLSSFRRRRCRRRYVAEGSSGSRSSADPFTAIGDGILGVVESRGVSSSERTYGGGQKQNQGEAIAGAGGGGGGGCLAFVGHVLRCSQRMPARDALTKTPPTSATVLKARLYAIHNGSGNGWRVTQELRPSRRGATGFSNSHLALSPTIRVS